LRQLGSDYHARAEAQAAVTEMLPLLQFASVPPQDPVSPRGSRDPAAMMLPPRRSRDPAAIPAARPASPPTIACHALTVRDPDMPARLLPLDMKLNPGDRVLIQGPSG